MIHVHTGRVSYYFTLQFPTFIKYVSHKQSMQHRLLYPSPFNTICIYYLMKRVLHLLNVKYILM